MDLTITILPVVTKDLPISTRFTPYNFLSRCKFSTLTTRQPMVEFHLLTFPRFPLRKKEHKSYFGKNRTHDFRTSRCAGYLLDHSSTIQTTSEAYKQYRDASSAQRSCSVPDTDRDSSSANKILVFNGGVLLTLSLVRFPRAPQTNHERIESRKLELTIIPV